MRSNTWSRHRALTEIQVKRRVGEILGLEEHGNDADWFAIAKLSKELLHELPCTAPSIVRAYLTDTDIRMASNGYAHGQLAQLVKYLRS